MAAQKAASLPLSAVSVETTTKKQHAPAYPLFLPGVRDVVIWALINAVGTAFSVAFGLIVITSISRHPPSWLLPVPAAEPEEVVTDTEAHAVLMAAMLWCVCVVSQAIAGALALALPRRHRLLLAYAALVATTAGHCIWGGFYIMFVARGRRFRFWTGFNYVAFFVSGVGDLICFRGLFLRGGEEE